MDMRTQKKNMDFDAIIEYKGKNNLPKCEGKF